MSRPRPSPACPWRCGAAFTVAGGQGEGWTVTEDVHDPDCPELHPGRRHHPGWMRGLGRCTLAYGDNSLGRCAWDGLSLPARRRRWCSAGCSRAFGRNHDWQEARKAALRRDEERCVRCGGMERLEVNHITPVRGRHGLFGCWHHVDGLETLCRRHHLEVTARQRARGWVAVGEPGPPVEQLPLVP